MMRSFKVIGVVGSTIAILLSAGNAFAESNSERDNREGDTVRTQSADLRIRLATTTRSEMKDLERERLEKMREEAKARIETARAEAKKRIETVREEAKLRTETQREKVKQRLSDIKDAVKKQKAEQIAEKFDKLNKKWTDHFMKQLDRYGDVLIKIQERADIAATAGKDVTATNAAIQSARNSIDSARTAVIAQAAKTYVLDASTIANVTATSTTSGQDQLIKKLKVAFQAMHNALFSDLKALRDGRVKDAREAVKNALLALKQIPNVDDSSDGNDSSDNN